MKEHFLDHRFGKSGLDRIAVINQIIDRYTQLGYTLSLRQLYYQLVASDEIPNMQSEYKKLSSLLTDARLAGLVDWDAIEDRNRETITPSAWNSPQDILKAVAEQYQIDLWMDQPTHVEVVVEKDALSGVLEPVCAELRVRLTANKGYSSSSFYYALGKRLQQMRNRGKRIVILYLGDHDPSGMDMTKDVCGRSSLMSRNDVETIRIALNMDQVEQYSPPPNPTKDTDSRSATYRREYGEDCWELDALEPTALAELVRGQVRKFIEPRKWSSAEKREQSEKDALLKLCETFKGD